MTTVNIEDLQSHLTEFIELAAAGEPFTITREGKPLVTMVAVEHETSPAEPIDTGKRFGFLKGQFTIPENFDAYMQDEIIEMFEGRPGKFADIEAYLAEKNAH